jgi:hypothetical protein
MSHLLDLTAAIEQVKAELRAELLAELRSEIATDWPGWMNVETAARYLDITPGRLWKLKAAGAIPYVQEGPSCRIFFSRHDIDTWMKAQSQ